MPYVLSTAWVKEGKGDRLREWYRELGTRSDEAFFSSPFEIDRQHLEVMDETTVEGARGRVYAELQYALRNPSDGPRSVLLPERA